MAKSRAAKATTHEQLVDKLGRMKAVVFTGYTGLNVKGVTELRTTLRAAGIDMIVSKKTILRRALTSVGIDATPIEGLTGEAALVFGYDDEVTPAKLIATFGKANPAVVLKGAYVNGAFLDATQAIALSKLPGRDELRAKVVYVLASPMTGMVNVLAGSLRGLVNVLKARQDALAPAA